MLIINTSGVSKICLTCKISVMRHVYLVNKPRGIASLLEKATVEFGKRFFLKLDEILCWRQSKNTWGAWKTRGPGVPKSINSLLSDRRLPISICFRISGKLIDKCYYSL